MKNAPSLMIMMLPCCSVDGSDELIFKSMTTFGEVNFGNPDVHLSVDFLMVCSTKPTIQTFILSPKYN